MSLTVYRELEQRTPQWFAARCGIVTASAVGKLVTPRTIKAASNDDSRDIVALLASERVTGIVEDTFTNYDMRRGIDAEPYAREAYEKHTGTAVEECGFMVRDFGGYTIGYSPDGLVGDDGLIEIKAPRAKGHLSTIVANDVPGYYMAQLQTALLVSGRAWIDYVSFCGGMPLFVKRVTPDPRWALAITDAAARAEQDIAATVGIYEKATAGLPLTDRILYDEIEIPI